MGYIDRLLLGSTSKKGWRDAFGGVMKARNKLGRVLQMVDSERVDGIKQETNGIAGDGETKEEHGRINERRNKEKMNERSEEKRRYGHIHHIYIYIFNQQLSVLYFLNQ